MLHSRHDQQGRQKRSGPYHRTRYYWIDHYSLTGRGSSPALFRERVDERPRRTSESLSRIEDRIAPQKLREPRSDRDGYDLKSKSKAKGGDQMNEEILTVDEAAEILKLHPGTLYSWIRLGKGPIHFKMGSGEKPSIRIKRDDLDLWIAQFRQKGGKKRA